MIPACPLPLLPGSFSRKVPDHCLAPESVYACVSFFSSLFSESSTIGIGDGQGGKGALGCPSGWVGTRWLL